MPSSLYPLRFLFALKISPYASVVECVHSLLLPTSDYALLAGLSSNLVPPLYTPSPHLRTNFSFLSKFLFPLGAGLLTHSCRWLGRLALDAPLLTPAPIVHYIRPFVFLTAHRVLC